MKQILALTLAASLVATTATAGGFAEPMMEPEVIAEEAVAGTGGFLIPLLILAAIAIAISSSNGSSSAGPPVTF